MLSDDAYRSKLQLTMASLQAWTGFVADVARVEATQDGTSCRLALTPHCAHACPVALVLRADQHYDITIAGETYANRPLASLDLFLPLIEAITEGSVVTRHVSSSVTGLARGVSTVVTLPDGRVFADGGLDPVAAPDPAGQLETRDTHYLPYRRQNGGN